MHGVDTLYSCCEMIMETKDHAHVDDFFSEADTS